MGPAFARVGYRPRRSGAGGDSTTPGESPSLEEKGASTWRPPGTDQRLTTPSAIPVVDRAGAATACYTARRQLVESYLLSSSFQTGPRARQFLPVIRRPASLVRNRICFQTWCSSWFAV